MPGIITHYKIFFDTLEYLNRYQLMDPHSKLIHELLQIPFFKKAALFGTIGPNIFDYLPFKKNSIKYGSEISYFLHNEGYEKLIASMLNDIISYKDYNNEWSSVQRAYLYGYISHIVSDSILHPFIFYRTGFQNTNKKDNSAYYRELHLQFEYNLDQYFYYNDDNISDINLDEFLPVNSRYFLSFIDPAVKNLIIKSINAAYPEYKKSIVLFSKKDGMDGSYGPSSIDIISYFIKTTYWLKKNRNQRIIKLLKYIRRKKNLYSDFLVRYPLKNKVNFDTINLHKEKWLYPAGAKGLHYETVPDLIKIAVEQIAEIWRDIESKLFEEEKDITNIIDKLKTNPLTGEVNKTYREMHKADPIRLRY